MWDAVGPQVTRTLTAPRSWLGSLALLDLVRAVPAPSAIPDWLLALVSIGAGTAPFGVAPLLTWLLFAGVLYTVAPRLYPDRMGLPDGRPGFRLLVTGLTLAIARLFTAGDGPAALAWTLGIGTLVIAVGMGGLLGYLSRIRGWALLDPDDPPVQPVVGLARGRREAVTNEIRADLARTGLLGVCGAVLWLLALGVVLVVPCVAAGIVTVVLYTAYPLPELLVLGWVGADAVERVGLPVPTWLRIDLEASLYETIRVATHSMKGMFAALFVSCGLFGGAGYVLVGVSLLADLSGTLDVVSSTPIYVIAVCSAGAGVVGAGSYLLWYWRRQFHRLRPFLDQWSSTSARAAATAPARPWGLTVPPTLLVVAVAALGGGFPDPVVVRLMTLLIPLLLVGLIGTVYWTRQRSPTPVGREDLAITAGLLVQSVGLVLAAHGAQLWTAVRTGRPPPILFSPSLFVVVTLVGWGTVFPEIARYHQTATGRRCYVRSLFVCGTGVLFGVGTLFLSGGVGLVVAVVAVVLVAGGVALTVTTYYEI